MENVEGEKAEKRKDLLISYRDYYGQYHHHKERMAYEATVLYLGGAAWLLFRETECPLPWDQLFFIIVVGAVAFFFVCWQLRNRRDAANRVEASMRLLARLVGSKSFAQIGAHECKGVPQFLCRLRRWGPRFSEYLTLAVMVLTLILGAFRVLCLCGVKWTF